MPQERLQESWLFFIEKPVTKEPKGTNQYAEASIAKEETSNELLLIVNDSSKFNNE